MKNILATVLLMIAAGAALADECSITAMPKVIPAYKTPFSDGMTVVSQENIKEAAQYMEPLRRTLSAELKMAEDGMIKHDEAKTKCALATLVRWAKDESTSRMETGYKYAKSERQQSLFEIKWMLIGKTFSYMYVKDAATPEERKLIEDYLIDTADYLNDIVFAGSGEFKSPTNNHLYWNGLGLMVVGVATGQERFIKKARRTYEQGVSEITDDGFLPQEVARRNVALHYHGYAAAPLVLMAELSKKIGENWFTSHDGRIEKLLKRTIDGFADPDEYGRAIGVAQDVTTFTHKNGTAGDMNWIPFAYAEYGKDFASYIPIAPSYGYSFCGNVQQLVDAKFFEQQIPIVKKAHWWD